MIKPLLRCKVRSEMAGTVKDIENAAKAAAERQWLSWEMAQWWMQHDATTHGTKSRLFSIQAPFVRHATEIGSLNAALESERKQLESIRREAD